MKKLSAPFTKLLAVAACALTLGSCNRAEYAQLPKSPAYYGNTARATAPASPQQSVAVAPVAPQPEEASVAPAPAPQAAVAKVKTPAPKAAATTQPAAVTAQSETLASVATSPTAKPNLAQRLLINKVTKKVDKLMAQNKSFKQRSETAATTRIDGNLRSGLIFLLIGLIVSLFAGISGIFGLIGAILAIIGLIFIVLWLLDQA